MRVLVTGATGFLGRHVVDALRARCAEVVAIGRSAHPARQGVTSIEADLLADADLTAAIADSGAETLLHLAWVTEHGAFWTSPLNDAWVEATERLVLAFCRAGGARVVGVGTCAEYDWSAPCCVEESTPLAPATPYGVAKDRARQSTESIADAHGVASAWARVFLPIGAGEPPRKLVPTLIDVLRGAQPVIAVDGMAARDFLHASDVGDALAHVALSDITGPINVCAGVPTVIDALVAHLASRLGADPALLRARYTERPGDPRALYGDATRLRASGWTPALSIQGALDRILAGG